MSDSDRLLRQHEAAQYLAVSERHVFNLAKEHGLPRIILGEKSVRYRKSDLDAYLEQQRSQQ